MNRPSRNFSAIASHSSISLKSNLKMPVIITIAKIGFANFEQSTYEVSAR